MGTVVDSSVLIALERGGASGALALAQLPPDSHITVLQVAELRIGAIMAASPERTERRHTFFEHIRGVLPVLPFDEPAAETWAEIFPKLQLSGSRIGERDLIIAAIALTHGHSVLTANVREFERVPGLTVERWS